MAECLPDNETAVQFYRQRSPCNLYVPGTLELGCRIVLWFHLGLK